MGRINTRLTKQNRTKGHDKANEACPSEKWDSGGDVKCVILEGEGVKKQNARVHVCFVLKKYSKGAVKKGRKKLCKQKNKNKAGWRCGLFASLEK